MVLTYAGRPLDALAVLAPLGPPTNRRARSLRALAEVPALVATGRCVTAVEAAGRAFAEQSELPDQIAIADPGTHVLMQIYGLAECGRLEDAVELATAAYEAIPATAPPDGLMWLSHQLGRCALLRGQVATAKRWLGEALARCDAHDIVGPSRLVLSLLGNGERLPGRLGRRGATRWPRWTGGRSFPFARPEQELGRAWALVAAGDLPGARDALLAAAHLASTTGYRVTEAWLLHDVVRLGDSGIGRRSSRRAGAGMRRRPRVGLRRATRPPSSPADRRRSSTPASASNGSAPSCSPPKRRPRRRRRSSARATGGRRRRRGRGRRRWRRTARGRRRPASPRS